MKKVVIFSVPFLLFTAFANAKSYKMSPVCYKKVSEIVDVMAKNFATGDQKQEGNILTSKYAVASEDSAVVTAFGYFGLINSTGQILSVENQLKVAIVGGAQPGDCKVLETKLTEITQEPAEDSSDITPMP